jgi:sugar fermentation stimulation protein A
VKLQGPFVYGEFIERPNRFLAICRVKGRRKPTYIPNPGPMPDLLFPGVEVLLRHDPADHRKTDYDLICARNNGIFLSLDSRVPNWLLAETLPRGLLAPFAQYTDVHTEPVYRESRLDFLLQDDLLPPCLIEAKSSTDAENAIGYFPRAITARGQRHLHELMHAVREGYRAAIIFIVQRTDAKKLCPNDRIDPAFGQILRRAAKKGVETHAWTTHFDEAKYEINIDEKVPVDLTPQGSMPDHER